MNDEWKPRCDDDQWWFSKMKMMNDAWRGEGHIAEMMMIQQDVYVGENMKMAMI